MMRGGKDEEKEMSLPMFPRLHVNDTEKGGPRAPPRNKMALYEQFSIPSQRLGSGSKPLLPLPPNNSSSLAPSVSSNNGGGSEKTVCKSSNKSPESSGVVEKQLHSGSSIGNKVHRGSDGERAIKDKGYQGVNVIKPIPTAFKYNPLQQFNFSNFKNLGNKVDLRIQSRNNLHQSKGQENISKLDSRLQQCREKSRLSQNSMDVCGRFDDRVLATASSNAKLCQEDVTIQEKMIYRKDSLVELSKSISRGNSLKRIESGFRSSLGAEQGILSSIEKRRKVHEEKKTGSMSAAEVGKDDTIIVASVVKSFSPLDISPDDVVGIIGEKLFWKARRAIVNQQRVFAVQVFELHRLLKVQKLIAGSVALILDDTLAVRKTAFDISPVKKLLSIEPSPIVKHSTRIPNLSIECADENTVAKVALPPITECADENAVAKVPLPSVNSNTCDRRITSRAINEASLGNTPSAPASINDRPPPWCFSPPGNQWLVPVMSPSEGLIYKPYAGPCPPNPGFMAPVYGNFPNPAYGISPFAGVQSNDNQPSERDRNLDRQQQSSCNASSQMSQAAPRCIGKLVRSKESEIQGSTASTPSKKGKGNVLSLFPMEPTAPASDHQDSQTIVQKTQVIKVVPLNPRLATASAARIFQSIQEERRRYD